MAFLWAVIRTIGILAASILLLPCAARAQESSQELEAAWIQLSDENIECATFYSIVGRCMESADDKSISKRATKAVRTMLDRAVKFTAQAKMKSETVDARQRLAIESMGVEIGKDCRNVTILAAEYGKACLSLFEDPTAREIQVIREQMGIVAPTKAH